MKVLKWIVLLIVFLLFSLFITLPASKVLSQLKLNEHISMGAVNGPWWSFQVDWISYRDVVMDTTYINLNFICLLQASACIQVRNDQANIQIRKPFFSNETSIENSQLTFDFEQLEPWMKTLFVKPAGNLEIKAQNITLKQDTLMALNAQVYWNAVGIQGETLDLGQVNARLTQQPGTVKILLSDQSDKLDLSGQITINHTGTINSRIELKTLSGFPASIKTVLQGVMQKRGRDIFEYKAQVNNPNIKKIKIKE